MTQLEHFKISEIEELKIFLVKYGPLIKKNTHFFTSSLSSLNKKSRENTLSQIPNYKEILDYLIKKDEIIIINIQQNIQFYILKTIEDLFFERLRILKIDIHKIMKNENFIKRKLLIDRLKNSGYQYNKNRFFIEILSWMKKDNILDGDKIYLTHYIFLPENKQIFIDYRRDTYNKNSKTLQKKRHMAQFFDERLFSKLDFLEKEIEEYIDFMLILEEKDLFRGRSVEKMRKSALWVILKKNGKVLNGGINQFCEEIGINKKDLFSYLSIISQNVAILEKSFSNKEIIKNLINSVMKYFGTQNRYVFIWALTILKELFKTNKINTRRGLNILNAAIIYGIYYFLKDLNLLSKNEKITQNILCRDFRCSEVSLRKEVKLIERIINNKTESLKKSISNPHLKGNVYFFGYIKSLISPFITENEVQEILEDHQDIIIYIEDDQLNKLIKYDENGVFRCKCGVAYLSTHETHIFNHLRKCEVFIKFLDKEPKEKEPDLKPLYELKGFIEEKMRMRHIYQPIIIKYLLENSGLCNIDGIVEYISLQLIGDFDYYKKRILSAPKKVLTYHKIVQFEHDGTLKLLFDLTDSDLKKELVELCNKKIQNCLRDKSFQEKVKKKFTSNSEIKLFPESLDKNELFEFIKLNEIGVFSCNCGKNYLSSQKTHIINHIIKCKEFIKYFTDYKINKVKGKIKAEDKYEEKIPYAIYDFSSFQNLRHQAALNCFLVDKWYKISPTQGVSKYTSMDYWINFYKHYDLKYNILEAEKSHRLQLMILFSGKMVKSDSIDYNRQVRQFGCNYKYGQGIWNVGYNAKGEIKLTAKYLEVIKQDILKGEKMPLIPLLRILYHREFNEKLAKMKIIDKFIGEFNLNKKELSDLFIFDFNLEREIEKIYIYKERIKESEDEFINESNTLASSSFKTKIKRHEKKPSMKNLLSKEFIKVIKSTDILGPSQFKKDQISFFIDFYTHHFSKDLFSWEELNEYYLYEYFRVNNIQGINSLSYIKDTRFGRLAFFKHDSKTSKYVMSDLTSFIYSLNLNPKERTFLHFIIRIPHFLVFCILFGYSNFVIRTSEEIQFFKKRTRINTKDHFLKIYSGVYKNSKLVGKLRKYYFNMLDWLEILEFTDIIDNKITPSEKLKNFIYGDLSGDFSLPNKVGRIIEEVINDLEVL